MGWNETSEKKGGDLILCNYLLDPSRQSRINGLYIYIYGHSVKQRNHSQRTAVCSSPIKLHQYLFSVYIEKKNSAGNILSISWRNEKYMAAPAALYYINTHVCSAHQTLFHFLPLYLECCERYIVYFTSFFFSKVSLFFSVSTTRKAKRVDGKQLASECVKRDR